MDDPRPPLGASRQGGAPSHQRVDQGVVPVAGRRVNDQTGRLVDYGEVLVLEDERERDVGGLERSRWLVLRDPDGYDLAPGKKAGSASDLSVNGNPLVGDETSGLGPRHRHLIGQEPIESFSFPAENCEFNLALGIRLGPDV
jgi:hypothetical protein